MKTFVRLIRRYVLAAVGIVLLLLFSGVAVLGWLGWQEKFRWGCYVKAVSNFRSSACRSGSIHPARSRIPWWRPPKGLPLGQNAPRRSG